MTEKRNLTVIRWREILASVGNYYLEAPREPLISLQRDLSTLSAWRVTSGKAGQNASSAQKDVPPLIAVSR